MQYTEIKTNIKDIKVGDTILHNGEIKTICNNNISYSSFMGVCLFGDSYNLGNKPVVKLIDIKY